LERLNKGDKLLFAKMVVAERWPEEKKQ
jgi:hypothetical protein